jgi:hypothetical protein
VNISARTMFCSALVATCALLAFPRPGFPDEAHPQPGSPAAASPASSASTTPAAPDVDLFPSQTYESLSLTPPATAAAEVPPPPLDVPEHPPEPAPPPLAPLPFDAVATWKDGPRETYVLDGLGQMFFLCASCHVPGAVHPGEAIANGYRLKSLNEAGNVATIAAPDGHEQSMPLVGMTH